MAANPPHLYQVLRLSDKRNSITSAAAMDRPDIRFPDVSLQNLSARSGRVHGTERRERSSGEVAMAAVQKRTTRKIS